MCGIAFLVGVVATRSSCALSAQVCPAAAGWLQGPTAWPSLQTHLEHVLTSNTVNLTTNMWRSLAPFSVLSLRQTHTHVSMNGANPGGQWVLIWTRACVAAALPYWPSQFPNSGSCLFMGSRDFKGYLWEAFIKVSRFSFSSSPQLDLDMLTFSLQFRVV